MWTGAFSAIPSSSGSQPENVRLTPEQTDEIVEAIADTLDDAELTIDELNEAVIAAAGHGRRNVSFRHSPECGPAGVSA